MHIAKKKEVVKSMVKFFETKFHLNNITLTFDNDYFKRPHSSALPRNPLTTDKVIQRDFNIDINLAHFTKDTLLLLLRNIIKFKQQSDGDLIYFKIGTGYFDTGVVWKGQDYSKKNSSYDLSKIGRFGRKETSKESSDKLPWMEEQGTLAQGYYKDYLKALSPRDSSSLENIFKKEQEEIDFHNKKVNEVGAFDDVIKDIMSKTLDSPSMTSKVQAMAQSSRHVRDEAESLQTMLFSVESSLGKNYVSQLGSLMFYNESVAKSSLSQQLGMREVNIPKYEEELRKRMFLEVCEE